MPYLLAGVVLVCLALHSVVVHRNPLRRIIALNVMGAGAFLLLIGAAARGDGPPDAVPHALVLTGIVVAVATSALAIAIVRMLHRTAPDEDDPKSTDADAGDEGDWPGADDEDDVPGEVDDGGSTSSGSGVGGR